MLLCCACRAELRFLLVVCDLLVLVYRPQEYSFQDDRKIPMAFASSQGSVPYQDTSPPRLQSIRKVEL